MNSQLAGAWELVSDTQNGIAVFTDTYFNITITAKDRGPSRPTNQQMPKRLWRIER